MKYGWIIIISVFISYLGLTDTSAKIALPRNLKSGHPNEIRVMVIDTGIGQHDRLKGFVQYDNSINYQDAHGHGTHVAGIVIHGNHNLDDTLCPQVKVFSCSYYRLPYHEQEAEDKTIDCFKKASEMKMDYLNYSGGGSGSSVEEYNALKEFGDQGGIAVVAAGNDGKFLSNYYPATYRIGFTYKTSDGKLKQAPPLTSIYVVQSVCGNQLCGYSNHHFLAFSEYGGLVFSTAPGNTYRSMSGTSQATPELLHKILKQRCEDLKNGVQQISK